MFIYGLSLTFQTLVYYVKLSPEPDAVDVVSHFGVKRKYAVYNIPHQISQHHVLNLAGSYNQPFSASKVQEPLLRAHRFQTGKWRRKIWVNAAKILTHEEWGKFSF